MSYRCANCGSHETQSFPEIYDAGRYSGTSTGFGAAYASDDLLPYGGVARHSGMTALAARLAPPKQAAIGCTAWIALGIALVGLFAVAEALAPVVWLPPHANRLAEMVAGSFLLFFGALFGILGSIGYIAESRRVRRYNRSEYDRVLAEWRASVHCHRCGNDFLVNI